MSKVTSFKEWMHREDYGDREQLERCWNKAQELARANQVATMIDRDKLLEIIKQGREIESKATQGNWKHFYPASRESKHGEIRLADGPIMLTYQNNSEKLVNGGDRWTIATMSAPRQRNYSFESLSGKQDEAWRECLEAVRADGDLIVFARNHLLKLLDAVEVLLDDATV